MVNTFLPYADFQKCAKVLDDKRLYKQIVECKQILNAIYAKKQGKKYGYQNHPIVKMWYNHTYALRRYMLTMFNEWQRRRFGRYFRTISYNLCTEPFEKEEKKTHFRYFSDPSWLGSRKLHRSHKSNLLRKDKEHYSKYFKGVPDDLEYEWVIE
jgi:hypothetical protein